MYRELMETRDELTHRGADMEDLYTQRDECLDRITEMDEEYNMLSQVSYRQNRSVIIIISR